MHINSMDTSEHTHSVNAIRVTTGRPPVREECRVVMEQPAAIVIEGVGDYTLMCTPSDLDALAVGFAFTEGLISKLGDIQLLHRCEEDANTIRMRLSEARLHGAAQARNLIIASSCGCLLYTSPSPRDRS